MKIILFSLISLYMCSVQANCDETWGSASYQQSINKFQVSGKTYFHSTPNNESKLNKLYLIPGDTFIGYLDFQNFEFGRYERKNGSVVMGWLRKTELTIKPKIESSDTELKQSDFSVYSPLGYIVLNSSFEDFYKKWGRCVKNEQKETGLWSNYISKGDKNYKYFDHYWKGFTIRSSNINYEELGSDFDTYRITAITITNKKYMTSRGISLGMNTNNIINVYGKPFKQDNNGIIYNYKYYTLSFRLEADVVTSIIMTELIQ